MTLVALNSVYVRYVARVQATFTVIKVLALLAIIVIGMVQIGNGKVTSALDNNEDYQVYLSRVWLVLVEKTTLNNNSFGLISMAGSSLVHV